MERAGLPFIDKDKMQIVDLGLVVSTPQECLKCYELCTNFAYITFDIEHLTELCLGMSPFSAPKIISHYLQKGLLKENPFIAIEDGSVGRLLKECMSSCRRVNAKMRFGANCGASYVCPRCFHRYSSMKILIDII